MVLIRCSLRFVLVEGQGKLSQGTLVHCSGLKEGCERVGNRRGDEAVVNTRRGALNRLEHARTASQAIARNVEVDNRKHVLRKADDSLI